MQRPGRNSDDIPFAPVKPLPIDDRRSCPMHHVVNGAAGVTVRLGLLAGSQQLDPASHRRHHGAARLRVTIFECNAIERATVIFAQRG